MSRAMYIFVRLFTPQFLWKETGSNTVRIPLPRTPFASLVVIQMERIFYLWMLRPICFYSEPMAMEETFFRVSWREGLERGAWTVTVVVAVYGGAFSCGVIRLLAAGSASREASCVTFHRSSPNPPTCSSSASGGGTPTRSASSASAAAKRLL